ncbi:hypothetical protein VNO77_27172 [Canavalia gladiata]|uniref:Uncharacterized protein n=1 Tax=Canavalia gladiata TaxID=3824 RepID=A0AAN9KTI9_CANGL
MALLNLSSFIQDAIVPARLGRIPELTDNEGRDSIPTSYDIAKLGLLSSADLPAFYTWFGHKPIFKLKPCVWCHAYQDFTRFSAELTQSVHDQILPRVPISLPEVCGLGSGRMLGFLSILLVSPSLICPQVLAETSLTLSLTIIN